MPGLLDIFNMQNRQQQGLLGAAAAILNASGSSTTPHSLGQVMSAGLLGGMQASQLAQDRQMQQAMRDLQMQKAGLELKQMQGSVDRMNRIRDRLAGQPSQPDAPLGGVESAPSLGNYMPGGENSPRIGGPAWMQAYQSQQQSNPPAMAAPPTGGKKTATQQLVDRLTYAAGVYSDEGDIEGANKLLEQAAKFMPEVKQIEVGTANGKPVNVITYKDGRQEVSQYGAAPKLHFADNGTNTAIPIDEYTGEVLGNGVKKGYSPGDLVSMRGQNMTDQRARDFNAIQRDANNIKRGEKQAETNMTKNSQIASFDTMLGTLDRLASHPGLSRSVGVVGAFPTMPGSDSANFQAELNTFQSQAFIPMVSQLKGMGALSDAEGKKLTAAVGALDPRMGEQAFRDSIERIKADMNAARQRVANSMRQPVAPGQVVRGYRFKGGDPAQQANWEKI